MLRIRKVKTKSKPTAIQVVQYSRYKIKLGRAKNDQKINALLKLINKRIDQYTIQGRLFPHKGKVRYSYYFVVQGNKILSKIEKGEIGYENIRSDQTFFRPLLIFFSCFIFLETHNLDQCQVK